MAAWLPLFVLSVCDGTAFSGLKIPFVKDLEAHARFLVALPILLWAGHYADGVAASMLAMFIDNRIVRKEDEESFHRIVSSVVGWNRSPFMLCSLVLLVIFVGHQMWDAGGRVSSGTWYGEHAASGWNLTLAGWWYVWVAIPILQFVLYRWYLRMAFWWILMRRISRLNLHLIATHPDYSAGLRFAGSKTYAFFPFLFAQGAIIAGVLATQIFLGSRHLQDFWREIAAFAVFVVVQVLGPLTVFTRPLIIARIKGQVEYARLSSDYVRAFEQKWIRKGGQMSEELMGNDDIQTLSGLAQGSEAIQNMKFLPFGKVEVLQLLTAFLLPIMPLMLTALPPPEDLISIMKMLL